MQKSKTKKDVTQKLSGKRVKVIRNKIKVSTVTDNLVNAARLKPNNPHSGMRKKTILEIRRDSVRSPYYG